MTEASTFAENTGCGNARHSAQASEIAVTWSAFLKVMLRKKAICLNLGNAEFLSFQKAKLRTLQPISSVRV